jgi:uncharacterized phage protein (TIGR02218 family)
MKTLSSGLQTHLQSETTTLATCWKLTRKDTTVLGFTDHDRDLVVSGTTYKASTGFSPTAIASSDSLSVDNLDVEGMLSSGSVTDADIVAGKYDFAEIEVFMVNWNDLTQGTIPLRKGWLGEVTFQHHQFVAEVRGLTQRLSTNIGQVYSPGCRAQFGDSRCQISLAAHTVTGTITSVQNNQIIKDSGRAESAGIFNYGKITFTTGQCQGLSSEIKDYLVGSLTLVTPMPQILTAGDQYSLVKGCDKNFATCKGTYNNAVNFRGEPHVPGMDRMLETAGTRSQW